MGLNVPWWVWHSLTLAGAVWLTYYDILHGQWVSDDWEGIAQYDGKFKRISHPGARGETAPVAQSPQGGSTWNDVLTWVRWQIGKAPNPNYNKLADPNKPVGPRDTRQFLPSPLRHHRLSLTLFSGVVVGVYCLLARLFGSDVAFYATLLWIAHPVGVQCVGWISGIGYLLACWWMVLGLNYALQFAGPYSPAEWVILGVGYGVLQLLAFRSQFTAMAAVVILFSLHSPYWIVALVVAFLGSYRTIREVVSVRSATFKAQQMGESTKLHWKKLVVVGKTFYYYVKLVLFPKRLGLYHTYGYHYPVPWIEWEDRYFWAGAALAVGALVGIVGAPPPIAFGLLWWGAFLVFVLNWITVHQFVAERYTWIPSIGICLIVATLAPTWLFWLLLGVALMRTWAHLPTYFSELHFYESNVWNHPKSEVAYGNLGVTYLRMQRGGSAQDTWAYGTTINPDYDVNWYNLASLYKSAGMLEEARKFLLKAVSCTTCHFPKEWRAELEVTEHEIEWRKAVIAQPPDQRDLWQKAMCEKLLAEPTLPKHLRTHFEAKLIGVTSALAGRPVVVPVSSPVIIPEVILPK